VPQTNSPQRGWINIIFSVRILSVAQISLLFNKMLYLTHHLNRYYILSLCKYWKSSMFPLNYECCNLMIVLEFTQAVWQGCLDGCWLQIQPEIINQALTTLQPQIHRNVVPGQNLCIYFIQKCASRAHFWLNRSEFSPGTILKTYQWKKMNMFSERTPSVQPYLKCTNLYPRNLE